MSWKVLITARTMNEVGAAALQGLRDVGCQVVIPPKPGPCSAETLLELLPEMDAVLASTDKFNGAVLASAAASRLKIISRWGVGYDSIDVPAATRAGIVTAYTPGLLDETVADFAFALLLALARRVHIGHLDMTHAVWRGVWGNDVFGKKLGVRFVSLDELLAQSDFVSLHAALTPQNRGLLGETELRKMKPSSYLIN